MAKFTFEGEVNSVTQEFLKKVLQNRGVKENTVTIETLGQAGDNFAANVKKITVKLDGEETFTMIAKIAPTHEMARLQMGIEYLFGNECLIYNEVLPKFVELQQAAGLSQEEIYRFPKCYGMSMEPMSEIILLENLKESNFEMLDRFTPLSNESVKQVLKEMAVFHSLSWVLKNQDPEKLEEYGGKFRDIVSAMSVIPEFQQLMVSLEEDILKIIGDTYKSAIRGSLSRFFEHGADLSEDETNSKDLVIIHGDAWNNNFMFRLDNNEPEETVLIDYQMSRLGSPVRDIQHMIFCSTDHNTRHKHYYEWIDFYHDEFDKSLNNFGLKAKYVYPRDQLDADLRRYSRHSFCEALFLYSMVLRKTEEAAKLKELMENNKEIADIAYAMQASSLEPETAMVFKTKVEDLVLSFREFDYLQGL